MAKQYKHILVPLDGSPLAETALSDALNMAQLNRAEVTLLQVISPIEQVITGAGDYPIFVDEQWELQKSQAMKYLAAVCERVECGDLKINRVVEMGPAAEMIIDYAHENPIDLIVMATHGRSGLQRWVYGSVADKVLRGANLPILLIRSHSVNNNQWC